MVLVVVSHPTNKRADASWCWRVKLVLVGDSSSSNQPIITVRILFVSYNNHLATHVNRGSQLISYLLSTAYTTSSVVIMLMR
jgi:hypothetical protein